MAVLRCFHRCSTDTAQQLLPFWLIFIWKLIFVSTRISERKVKCTIYVTKVSLTIPIAHRGLNQSPEQFPLLQRVYGLVSDRNALHPAPASAGQGGRTALQSLSLAAAPVPCPALSSMHLLLMGLAVFLLVILPSSGELVSISWFHVGDLASEIHVTAVPSDHGGWYEVPSSTSFSIATSYLRQFFFLACCLLFLLFCGGKLFPSPEGLKNLDLSLGTMNITEVEITGVAVPRISFLMWV